MNALSDKAEGVRRAFRDQADACARLGSPFTQRLCNLLAERMDDTAAVFARVLSWPGDPSLRADSLPLRLCGALHGLVLAGRDAALAQAYPPNGAGDESLWQAVAAAARAHAPAILARLASPPQTNEVRRAAVLLPGFLEIARQYPGRPLIASELGASAGLNMNWDRYRYRLGDLAWGAADSPVLLAPEWRGKPVPAPAAAVSVAEKAGCDLNPLDASAPDDRLCLLSYIWADQADRLALARAALEMRDRFPVRVERADAVDWLARRLATPRAGAIHVVYHSIAWQYFPEAARQAGEVLLFAAGARATPEAPLAWLRFEDDGRGPGASLRLVTWPGGADRELARADHHGRWVEWHGP
ncbi:MAG: DUF2332 domain-containing protein [Dongiaceae bacterium]